MTSCRGLGADRTMVGQSRRKKKGNETDFAQRHARTNEGEATEDRSTARITLSTFFFSLSLSRFLSLSLALPTFAMDTLDAHTSGHT